eukprot:8649510-Pyramimonas_sp.AAC.1
MTRLSSKSICGSFNRSHPDTPRGQEDSYQAVVSREEPEVENNRFGGAHEDGPGVGGEDQAVRGGVPHRRDFCGQQVSRSGLPPAARGGARVGQRPPGGGQAGGR